MAKRAKFTVKETTDKGWCINVPAHYSESGKRERHYYRTRTLAEEAQKKLKVKRDNHGTQAKAIPPTLAEQAVAAAALLSPFGITILEAAQRIAAVEMRKMESRTIENATAEFTLAKEDRSAKHTKEYSYMTRDLLEDFADRIISTITGEELVKHVQKRTGGPSAHNLRIRLLTAFWRWSARPPRQWCVIEPLEHLERKDAKAGEIGTLTPAQAQALLSAAEKHHPDTVPGFAIALFTGLRQAEIERLEPSDITAEGITVPASSAKTGRRRFVEMPAPLAAWLKAYPIGDSVLPSSWERRERAVRRLAGFKVWSDIVEPNTPPEKLPEWPQNALRHTAATVSIAMGKPIETLVFEHGHAGGLNVLRNHYVGRMTKKQALEIWSTGPKGTKVKLVSVA
jgi:integrase